MFTFLVNILFSSLSFVLFSLKKTERKSEKTNKKNEKITGTGSFGKVQLARHRASGRVCALKALSKANLLRSGQVAHLLSEKKVLESLSGEPAFVRLLATFQVRRWRKEREKERVREERPLAFRLSRKA